MPISKQSSLLVKIGGFIWFILMSVGAFVYFWFSIVSTFKAASLASSLVVFERGAYYLLGVGIVLMALVIIGLYENYTKKGKKGAGGIKYHSPLSIYYNIMLLTCKGVAYAKTNKDVHSNFTLSYCSARQ